MTKHVQPGRLKDAFLGMTEGMCVTTGRYEILTDTDPRDLHWNHMDPHHRPTIHRTYGESIRLAADEAFQVSIMKRPGTFLFFNVVDVRVSEDTFYQLFSVLGLIQVLSVISTEKAGDQCLHSIDWYIASKWYLKFLHSSLSKKLYRLNAVQNGEDEVVRVRRTELRKRGFSFATDDPDYINSSDLSVRINRPTLPEPVEFILPDHDRLERLALDSVELIVQRIGDGEVKVWPGVCPHEGAELTAECLKGDTIVCPWHLLKFKGTVVRDGDEAIVGEGYIYSIRDGRLSVSSASVENVT